MSTTGARFRKYVGIIVGIFILIPVIYLCFLYVTYIDKQITAGSAYGFTIGQSKADAYRSAQVQFRRGVIARIDTIRSREEEVKLFPGINGTVSYHTVAEVRGWFDNWDQWSLWLNGDSPSLVAVMRFHGDRLSDLSSGSATLGETWQVGDVNGAIVRVGQSYHDVYLALETLARTPGYESLVLDTGWMARRQPVEFKDEEYQYVAEHDEWTLLVGNSYFNNVRLTFDQGRLVRVHRHRQLFELP